MNMMLYEPLRKEWKPHQYQKKAVDFLNTHNEAMLWLDPGLGKTSIVLYVLKHLFLQNKIKRVLIVAPIRVCYSVWPTELEKWAEFEGITHTVIHGAKKEEALKKDVQLYIINFEGLRWLFKAKTTKKEIKFKTGKKKEIKMVEIETSHLPVFDILVVDELSRFKDPSSIQTKIMKKATPLFPRRWGLTGTPAANRLMDLFAQTLIIDGGKTFGPYITRFRNEFCFPASTNRNIWNMQKGADVRIQKRIAPLVLQMSATDYLDMPDLIINDIRFYLEEKGAALYKEINEDLISEFNKTEVVAVNIAAKINKLRQIANGGVYTEDGSTLFIHHQKTRILEELVTSLQGRPLLVFYWYKHDLERLYDVFGTDIPTIGGASSAKKVDSLVSEWNEGQHPILFGHPLSMGHGLNMQSSDAHVCFYALDYNYELYDQSIRRVWRQGNTNKSVVVHRIIAQNTVDEVLLQALEAKKSTQDFLFEGIKRLLTKES